MNGNHLFAGRLRRGLLLGLLCGMLVLLFSCGDDDPVTPGGGGTPPPSNDIPAVPTMTDPDQDPPVRSNTLSVIRKSEDFAPVIAKAFCAWDITGRGRYETLSGGWVDCFGDWMDVYTGTAWSDGSDAIPSFTGCFDACGLVTDYCPQGYALTIDDWPADTRFVFLKDNVKDPMPNMVEWDGPENSICREVLFGACISKVHVMLHYEATGLSIAGTPYMRRDRFWVATPWEGGAIVARTTGDEAITVSSSYTAGCSETETKSFAWSLGASVGLDYKGVKAEVEGSITKTFGTAFTVMEQTTQTLSKTLQGEANKRTCFVLWVLVEQYTFVDKNGNAFTDPNYEFDPGFYDEGGDKYYAFQSCGTQYEIGKYIFNLTTNELVSAEYVPLR